MAEKLSIFPVGTSVFKDIRVNKQKYVDKTMYIPLLKEYGKILFFARPRRFGKSLAISTMDSYFSGDKDLFKGLAVEEILNSPDFVPRPVIRLLMSTPSGADSKVELQNNIIEELTANAERHKVTPRGTNAASVFVNLIRDVSKANSNKKVVLLIDEYDAPVIMVIQAPALSKIEGLLEDTREVMSNFYRKIKDLDDYLDFVFIAGVTKFSRMGVFSALNNLKDISLLPEFASFVGFTQEELENNFRPFIKQTADKFQLSEPELLAKTQEYYNGFSFDGKTRLYNPQSTLYFFQDMEFNNYWIESGSNTLIREMIKDKNLTVDQFSGLQVTRDFVSSPGEIDSTPPEGFLYQAGYLTLREDPDSEISYSLDYPNFEVRSSMAKLFMHNVFRSELRAGDVSIQLKKHFDAGNISDFVGDFHRLFSSITYDDHTAGVRLNLFLAIVKNYRSPLTKLIDQSIGPNNRNELIDIISDYIMNKNYKNVIDDLLKESPGYEEIRLKFNESFYRANMQSFLLGAGLKVVAELHNNLGRSDLVVESKGKQYVIEIKVVPKSSQAEDASENAINQIFGKGYGSPFPNPVLVGLGISEENRNIDACVYVENDQAVRLDMPKLSDKVLKAFNASRQATHPEKTPKPKEPKPSGAKPREPKPSGSKPKEPKPSGPKPKEPKPSGAKPSGAKSSGPKPKEPKPSGPKP
ncbi:MAG: AAA family ATPase [Deltaproteobacteria bacterium]|jgi:hypothetical protein|nr:AAA family ATPase [Deltaproteobacteria bacterium]